MLRVEYAGAIHPVMNRGDRREPIVKDDADRERFVETRVTAGWIADRPRMGSVANANTLLYHRRLDRRK
jgi:hypothetical protein